MPARRLLVLALALVMTCSVLLVPAGAQSAEADCRNLSDPSWSGWYSYEQVVRGLERIEQTSNGRVDVEVIGESHRGRDIHAARVGSGDQVMLVTSEIHGNEKTGTVALMQILQHLGSSGAPDVREILDNVTIVAIPMFNADGGMLNRRQNDFPWSEVQEVFPQLDGAPPAWYYSRWRGGFDVNRDFNPDLTYEPRAEDLPGHTLLPGFFITNEARALRDLYLDLDEEFDGVDVYVDLHHMGPCNQVEGDGQHVSVALDYPPLGPDDSGKYDEWTELDQAASRRAAYAAYVGLMGKAGNGNGAKSPFLGGVTRYIHFEARDYPGQARSSFALNGTSTVLFEVRGQSHAWGQKQMGMLSQVVKSGLLGIAEAYADGSVHEFTDEQWFAIPDYGW